MLDLRAGAGAITLPLTSDIPYRVLTVKDIYGVANVSSLTLATQGTDVFENGQSTMTITDSFDAVTLYAGQPGFWYTIGGSKWAAAKIGTLSTSILTVSTINGAAPWLLPNAVSTTQGLGTAGYISTGQLISSITAATFTGSTSYLSASMTIISSINVNSLTAVGATVTKAGLTTSNTYGTGSDTLTIQTTAGGTSGGVASLYFGTPTYGYPLGRIAALDTGSSYDTSALIFQNATITANSAASGTNTFTYTGSAQSYTVPAGVTSVTVKMWGAGGGNGGSSGAGAYLTGSLAVTPGQVLSLIVGGSGNSGGYGGGGTGSQGAFGNGGGRSAIQTTFSGTITGVVGNGTIATFTTSIAHGLIAGEPIIISSISGYVGTYTVITVPTPTTFTVASSTNTTLTGQAGTFICELVDVGGGGAQGVVGVGGSATYSGTANSGTGSTPGFGGSQTSGGAAGGSGSGAGTIFQGGNAYRTDYYSVGGGGGGYYGGGGSYATGPTTGGSGGGGSSWSGLLTSMSGANSVDGSSAPGSGVAGYISGVASAGGNGLIIIVVPLAYNLAESMRISNNGYLGIGTSTPSMLLDVAGSARTSTIASGTATTSTLAINDRTTPSTGSLYQISSVLYYNNTVIGGAAAATVQTLAF